MFFSYCGPGTFLAFALMTLAILPIALVYSEISPLFHTAGGELIYNTVGFNRHVGFLASWLIMAAWISVPPAVVMAIVTFISRTFGLGLTFGHTMIIGIIILVAVFLMSMQDIQFLVKAQAVCLFANITTTLLTGVLLLFSGLIAAVGLVLPGISVSYLLLLMGLYDETMRAISKLYLPFLIPLGLGLLSGIVPTTKVLERAMEAHPQPTYLIMLGFMLGSMAELFPGIPGWPEVLLCLATLAAGFLIIWGISKKD